MKNCECCTNNDQEHTISIPISEYRELLEYKGRYLELKEQSSILKYPAQITYTGEPFKSDDSGYKVSFS